MSSPNFLPSAGVFTFTAPSTAQTGDVTSGVSLSDRIYRTTSGAQFRCKTGFDIDKLWCCQCAGGARAHIVEARSLRSRSSEASEVGVVNLTPRGVEDCSLFADVKCAKRDTPLDYRSYPEDPELTQMAQQALVVCAHIVADGRECGDWLPLSELPSHHHSAHLAHPQNTWSGWPEPPVSSAPPAGSAFSGGANAGSASPAGFIFSGGTNAGSAAPVGFKFSGGTNAGLASPTGLTFSGGASGATNQLYPVLTPAAGKEASVPIGTTAILCSHAPSQRPASRPAPDRKGLPPLFGFPKVPTFGLSKRVEDNEKGIKDNEKGMEDNKKGIEDNKKIIEDYKRIIEGLTQQVATLHQKNDRLEDMVARLNVEVANSQDISRKHLSEVPQFSPHNNGTIHWKLENFKDSIDLAKRGMDTSFSSPHFFTRSGYKLCAKIYPNGDGSGHKTHVSLYVSIMKTDNDRYLEWPFSEKVVMSVIGSDAKELCRESYIPNPTSSSFRKPVRDLNIASGVPCFLPLEKIEKFLVDGALLLKISAGDQI